MNATLVGHAGPMVRVVRGVLQGAAAAETRAMLLGDVVRKVITVPITNAYLFVV